MKANWWRSDVALRMATAVALIMTLAGGTKAAAAQDKPQKPAKETKDSKKKAEPVETSAQGAAPQGNDNEIIDYRIAELLAGWQLGDTAMLHSVYADDVTVVSGAYEPPIIGWANFLATYQKLRERVNGGQKDRYNTYTLVRGTTAWSCFQWEFNGQVDGNIARWRGQTTLILEKRAGIWKVVHDHTSVVADSTAPPAPKP